MEEKKDKRTVGQCSCLFSTIIPNQQSSLLTYFLPCLVSVLFTCPSLLKMKFYKFEVNIVVGMSCGLAHSSSKRPIEVTCCSLLALSDGWQYQSTRLERSSLCIPVILSLNHLQTPQYSETAIIQTSSIQMLCLGPRLYAYVNQQHRLSECFHLVLARLDNRDCTIQHGE